MNKRAERFKKFIADQKVEGFTIEEPKSEPNNLVLFGVISAWMAIFFLLVSLLMIRPLP